VAVPVKIGALIVSSKLVENISRFLAEGAVKRLDNMMLSSHEKGTIVNAPGIKNFGTPKVDLDESGTEVRTAPSSGVQTYNGINFFGVVKREGGAQLDKLVIGGTTYVLNRNTGADWQQEFWWGDDPGDKQPLSVETDGLNNPFPAHDGNNHPIYEVPHSKIVKGWFSNHFWKHRGWTTDYKDANATEDLQEDGHTISVGVAPAVGTLTLSNTATGEFLYEAPASGTVSTASIDFKTAAFTESQIVTFKLVQDADVAGNPQATDMHFLVPPNSNLWNPAIEVSPSTVTNDRHFWKETGSGALESVTVVTPPVYGITTTSMPKSSSTTSVWFLPDSNSIGYVDSMTMRYTFTDTGTTTSTWYFWVMPNPGIVNWNTIHTIDDPAYTNSKALSAGVWSHASMNGDTYFFDGSGTFGDLSTKNYWTCKTATPSTVTTSIAKTAPDIFPAGTISAVTIVHGGTGYTADDLTFTVDDQGAGSGATGNYTVAGGVIDSTAITVNGSGYTKPPAVTGDTGGSGAILKPVIPGQMTYSSTTSGGEVRGVVRYKVSHVSDGIESALSKNYLEVSLDGLTNTVTISNIPTTTVTGDTTRLYRTEAGRKQYYFLDYVPYVDGTDPYTDTTNDLELGDFPEFHGEPPPENGMCPIVYYDRMWCLGGIDHNTLYWSDLNEPQSWSMDSNYADIYANDGDFGTVLIRDFNGLLVFKSNHLYRLAGRTPSDMVLSELTLADGKDVSLGCPHLGATAATPEGLFFYWKGSIYRYRAGRIKRVSEDIDPTLNRIRANHEDQIWLGYWPNESLLLCSFGRDNFDTGDERTWGVTYIYNLSDQAWVGRILGFYGPFTNTTISPSANALQSTRKFRTALAAGAHNSRAHNTASNLNGFVSQDSLQLVWFDNELPETGETNTRGRSIGRTAGLNKSTTAGENHGERTLEFQPFYGEPKERNIVKRFLYADIIVTDTSSDFDIEIDIDESESVLDVNYDVTTAGAGYTVYRCYIGAIGWKATVRVTFNDNNDGDMAFLGGSVAYQPSTSKGFTAIPPRGKVA
jgi:hypothetical protein